MPSPTQARSFMRSAARYLTEPHPFARNPTTMASHPIQWRPYVQHFSRAGTFYFPAMAFVIGWPLGAAWLLNKTGM
ncbi:hypothetical protein BDV96DRAFT_571718 [Lophiotrema nucula]|uniref:Uncharacterized protein n=1 Tax=Lophiotrema nucula TaxID=690887 RepID=A0A6A5ZDB7_9PLEO|nr:hypothetical protein BDV96DRAFT_571718 [Lophiotrema nucula]